MKNNYTIIMMILSVLFIPAAYVFVIAIFMGVLFKDNFNFIENGKNNKIIYLASIWIIIVTILSQYKSISAFFLLMIISCIVTLLYISYRDNLPDKEQFLMVLYILALITYAIGFVQMFSTIFNMPTKWVDSSQYNIDKRMFSTFFNPNVYGFFINIVILCIVSNITSKDKSKTIAILENVTLPISILCLFLTFSRTSWVSLIGALLVLSFFTDKKYIKYVIIITLFLLIADKISGAGRSEINKIANDSSFAYRLELWRTSLKIIKDHMFFGIGFGTFFKYTSQYSVIITHYIEHCHNIYLQILMETGIFGFTLFLIAIYNIFKAIYINYKRKNNCVFYKMSALIIVMTLIHGLVDSVPLTPQIMFILSIFMGIFLYESKQQVEKTIMQQI